MTDRELVQLIRAFAKPMAPIPTGVAPRLDQFRSVRVVLCDVYGTLVISGSGDIGVATPVNPRTAMQAAWEACDTPVSEADAGRLQTSYRQTIEEEHTALKARGIKHPEVDIHDIWGRVIQRHSERLDIEKTVMPDLRRLAVTYESLVNPTWAMPGAQRLLEALSSMGIRLGIVSNAQFYTPLTLEAHFGAPPANLGFDERLCAWSYRQGEAKPSTNLFRAVIQELDRMHVAPHDCIYLGNDMLNDVYTANRCGFLTALFAGDQRSLRTRDDDSRCRGLQPTAVITDLSQLTDLIAR